MIHQPPGPAVEGAELDGCPVLNNAMLGARHRSLHDLAVDQFDALLRACQQAIEGLEPIRFHRGASQKYTKGCI